MLLAAFPGKVALESTALSGGEKTITATVFLLALQSLKPSPFYLMDEVDAHLDAQNTERLSKVLTERSQNSQIIMVTLKDSTVAKATLIYGVYPKQGATLKTGASLIRPIKGATGRFAGLTGWCESVHHEDGSWTHTFHFVAPPDAE